MKKLSLVFLSLLLLPVVSYAGLTVRPSRIEMKLPAGETYKGTYSVRNDFASSAEVKIETRDWYTLPENAGISVAEWLTLSPVEFKLPAGGSQTVNYEVRVPTAAQGSLVGMVSFVPATEDEQGVTLVLSASMFVTVSGTEKKEWELIAPKVTRSPGGTQFSIEVSNKGNIHIRPTGYLSLLSGGDEIKRIPFIEGRPVYPGSSRTIVTASSTDINLAQGEYTAVFAITCADEEKKLEQDMAVTTQGDIELK